MGSWTYSAKLTQGCTTQQKTSSGYEQNIMGTQNRIWKMGKTTQVTQIIMKTLDVLPKEKTTSVQTQIGSYQAKNSYTTITSFGIEGKHHRRQNNNGNRGTTTL